jgi:hypothetical protein
MSLWFINNRVWLKDSLDNSPNFKQTFLHHQPADENSLKNAASSIFKIALEDENQFRVAQMCCTFRKWRNFAEVTFLKELVNTIQVGIDAKTSPWALTAVY